MTYGVSNGHVTDDITWTQRCSEAVRSAILATAWLLVMQWLRVQHRHNRAKDAKGVT